MKLIAFAFASLLLLTLSKRIAAQDACTDKLTVAFTPALARVGESVKVRLMIQQYLGDISFNDFNGVLEYEEGIIPDPDSIQLVKYLEGVFWDGLAFADLHPTTRRMGLAVIGSKITSSGSVRFDAAQTTGPVLDIVIISVSQTPKLYTFILTEADVFTTNTDLFFSCPTTGTIRVIALAHRGDVDGDGAITVADAQWAIRLLLGSAVGSPGVLASADVWPQEKGDGHLTLADVVTLLRAALLPPQ